MKFVIHFVTHDYSTVSNYLSERSVVDQFIVYEASIRDFKQLILDYLHTTTVPVHRSVSCDFTLNPDLLSLLLFAWFGCIYFLPQQPSLKFLSSSVMFVFWWDYSERHAIDRSKGLLELRAVYELVSFLFYAV